MACVAISRHGGQGFFFACEENRLPTGSAALIVRKSSSVSMAHRKAKFDWPRDQFLGGRVHGPFWWRGVWRNGNVKSFPPACTERSERVPPRRANGRAHGGMVIGKPSLLVYRKLKRAKEVPRFV